MMLAHARGFGERHVAQLVDADQIEPLPSAQYAVELAHQGRDRFGVPLAGRVRTRSSAARHGRHLTRTRQRSVNTLHPSTAKSAAVALHAPPPSPSAMPGEPAEQRHLNPRHATRGFEKCGVTVRWQAGPLNREMALGSLGMRRRVSLILSADEARRVPSSSSGQLLLSARAVAYPRHRRLCNTQHPARKESVRYPSKVRPACLCAHDKCGTRRATAEAT
jgi:hypothetical protein